MVAVACAGPARADTDPLFLADCLGEDIAFAEAGPWGDAPDALLFSPEEPRRLLERLTEAFPNLRAAIAEAAEAGAARYQGGPWTAHDLSDAMERHASTSPPAGASPDSRPVRCSIARADFAYDWFQP